MDRPCAFSDPGLHICEKGTIVPTSSEVGKTHHSPRGKVPKDIQQDELNHFPSHFTAGWNIPGTGGGETHWVELTFVGPSEPLFLCLLKDRASAHSKGVLGGLNVTILCKQHSSVGSRQAALPGAQTGKLRLRKQVPKA